MEREHDGHEQGAVEEVQESVIEQHEEKESLPERLRFEKLPKDEQEKLLGVALEQMRQAIGPVRDYAVFASTAMYLNGERLVDRGEDGGKELMAPPGDFDAAVFTEDALNQIRERLSNMPNVEFDNNGRYISMVGEEARKLAGKIVLELERNNEKHEVEYDFEFFYKTFIVPKELAQGRTIDRRGLKALDLEALHGQYEKNLNFESAINEGVMQVVQFIESDHEQMAKLKQEVASGELSAESERVLDHLKVSSEDMHEAFGIQEKIRALEKQQTDGRKRVEDLQKLQMSYENIGLEDKARDQEYAIDQAAHQVRKDWKEMQELISKRATILAGTKTKIWKRELNILQLAKIRGRE
jgi:hypothetical protein